MEENFTEFPVKILKKLNIFEGFNVTWAFSVPDQRYIFISPSFEKLTGYKINEVCFNPKLWLDLIQEYETSKSYRRIINDTMYFESTYTMKNVHGEKLKVEEILFPIFDEKDQLIQLQGYSKMKKEIPLHPHIIDEIPFPYFVVEGVSSGWIITTISRGFKSVIMDDEELEIKVNELKKLNNLINERIDEIKSKKFLRLEYELLKNEYEKIYLIELFYNTSQEEKEKIIGVASDITEIKLNERRLQKLNIDKNRLLSIVSHDLKSPFNTILNFLNLINDGIEIDEEQKKEYLKYIYDTTKQQLDLIHDLLDWSKVEAGFLEFSPSFILFNQLLGKVISGFSGQIYQKGIQVVQEYDKDLKVFFDKNYLKIVLSNIISNAIKFSHKNSKIIISAKDEDEFTVIDIRDFGIGFSDRYFKKLTQLQDFEVQIGTMGEKGSGLGLKFCYDIITSNFGKLNIETKSQKGTRVIIKLRKPQVVGIYFGEDEIKEIKNGFNKILPEIFLCVSRDIFDLLRFSEKNRVDVVFVNLDVIKTFQPTFIQKVFSEFNEKCKIIGFSDNPEELKNLISYIQIDSIENFSMLKEKIKTTLNEILSNKRQD